MYAEYLQNLFILFRIQIYIIFADILTAVFPQIKKNLQTC